MFSFLNLSRLATSLLKGLLTLLLDAKIWVAILAIAFIWAYKGWHKEKDVVAQQTTEISELNDRLSTSQKVTTKIIYRERKNTDTLAKNKEEQAKDETVKAWASEPIPDNELGRLRDVWQGQGTDAK